MQSDPIVVGGTGGSGTRLVALLLKEAGVFMGQQDDLNYAMDSIPMNLLDMFYLQRQGTDLSTEVTERAVQHHHGYAGSMRWGWKHTQSHLTLPMLHHYFPRMGFVHVVRDGREIACTAHINLRHFGVWNDGNPGPITLIALWEALNLLCADYGEFFLDVYHRVRYEDLCDKPEETIATLYEALELRARPNTLLVRPSPTRGRAVGRPWFAQATEIASHSLRRFGYIE